MSIYVAMTLGTFAAQAILGTDESISRLRGRWQTARGYPSSGFFNKPQLDALAMTFLRLHGQGIVVSEIFWGLWLLPFGLLLTETLLLASLTLEVLLALPQAVLVLPGLCPALIEQRQTECEHGIDMLGFPMHAWSFETGLYHELMATLDTSRPNRPTRGTVGRIVHQLAPLLQVGHLLLDLRVAPS